MINIDGCDYLQFDVSDVLSWIADCDYYYKFKLLTGANEP